jgi:hypothetical protein
MRRFVVVRKEATMKRIIALATGILLLGTLAACAPARDNAYNDRDCPYAHPCVGPGSTTTDSEGYHKN